MNIYRNIQCPVCETLDMKRLMEIEVIDSHHRYFCTVCGCIFFSSVPDKMPVYDLKYNMHFYRVNDIKKAGHVAGILMDFLATFWEKPLFLEAGCGNGLILYLLQKAGFLCAGIDIDPMLSDYLAKNYGIQVFPSRVEDFKSAFGYDFVYSSHVIEHVKDPALFFAKLASFLKPGGLLYLETPDTQYHDKQPMRWHHFDTRDPFEHVCLLGVDSVKLLASRYGLRFLYLRSDPLFMSLTAVMGKGTIKPFKTPNLTLPNEALCEVLGNL